MSLRFLCVVATVAAIGTRGVLEAHFWDPSLLTMKSLPPSPSLNSSVVLQIWTILHGLRVALRIVRRRVAENVASQRFSQGMAATLQMGYYELNMMNGHKRLVEGENRLIGRMTEMLSTQMRGQTFAMPTEVKGLS